MYLPLKWLRSLWTTHDLTWNVKGNTNYTYFVSIYKTCTIHRNILYYYYFGLLVSHRKLNLLHTRLFLLTKNIYLHCVCIHLRYNDTCTCNHSLWKTMIEPHARYYINQVYKGSTMAAYHNDVMPWKRFLCYWSFWGNPVVTGGFPYCVLYDVSLNKRLNKHTRFRWFKTQN